MKHITYPKCEKREILTSKHFGLFKVDQPDIDQITSILNACTKTLEVRVSKWSSETSLINRFGSNIYSNNISDVFFASFLSSFLNSVYHGRMISSYLTSKYAVNKKTWSLQYSDLESELEKSVELLKVFDFTKYLTRSPNNESLDPIYDAINVIGLSVAKIEGIMGDSKLTANTFISYILHMIYLTLGNILLDPSKIKKQTATSSNAITRSKESIKVYESLLTSYNISTQTEIIDMYDLYGTQTDRVSLITKICVSQNVEKFYHDINNILTLKKNEIAFQDGQMNVETSFYKRVFEFITGPCMSILQASYTINRDVTYCLGKLENYANISFAAGLINYAKPDFVLNDMYYYLFDFQNKNVTYNPNTVNEEFLYFSNSYSSCVSMIDKVIKENYFVTKSAYEMRPIYLFQSYLHSAHEYLYNLRLVSPYMDTYAMYNCDTVGNQLKRKITKITQVKQINRTQSLRDGVPTEWELPSLVSDKIHVDPDLSDKYYQRYKNQNKSMDVINININPDEVSCTITFHDDIIVIKPGVLGKHAVLVKTGDNVTYSTEQKNDLLQTIKLSNMSDFDFIFAVTKEDTHLCNIDSLYDSAISRLKNKDDRIILSKFSYCDKFLWEQKKMVVLAQLLSMFGDNQTDVCVKNLDFNRIPLGLDKDVFVNKITTHRLAIPRYLTCFIPVHSNSLNHHILKDGSFSTANGKITVYPEKYNTVYTGKNWHLCKVKIDLYNDVKFNNDYVEQISYDGEDFVLVSRVTNSAHVLGIFANQYSDVVATKNGSLISFDEIINSYNAYNIQDALAYVLTLAKYETVFGTTQRHQFMYDDVFKLIHGLIRFISEYMNGNSVLHDVIPGYIGTWNDFINDFTTSFDELIKDKTTFDIKNIDHYDLSKLTKVQLDNFLLQIKSDKLSFRNRVNVLPLRMGSYQFLVDSYFQKLYIEESYNLIQDIYPMGENEVFMFNDTFVPTLLSSLYYNILYGPYNVRTNDPSSEKVEGDSKYESVMNITKFHEFGNNTELVPSLTDLKNIISAMKISDAQKNNLLKVINDNGAAIADITIIEDCMADLENKDGHDNQDDQNGEGDQNKDYQSNDGNSQGDQNKDDQSNDGNDGDQQNSVGGVSDEKDNNN